MRCFRINLTSWMTARYARTNEREQKMAEVVILSDGKNVNTETVKGWAVMFRPGRYLREWDRTTDRVEGITSHPEEAFLTTKGEADRLAEANIDEGDVKEGQPKAVFVVVTTTVIDPDKD